MKKTYSIGNLILLLLLLIAILMGIFISISPVGIRLHTENKLDRIHPQEKFTFQFSHPVDAEKVEQAFHISPNQNGDWTWSNDQQAQWQPSSALVAGEAYQLSFDREEIEHAALQLGKNPTWQVQVRPAKILALRDVDEGTELFQFSPTEENAEQQLTFTDGAVIDYSPSSNGEWIIISLINEANGADLWRLNKTTGDFQLFLDCDTAVCMDVSWTNDDSEFAFSRYSSSEEDRSGNIWLANNQTTDVNLIFNDLNGNNSRPLWSPDGNRLAYWDANRNKVVVYDFQDRLEYVLDGEDSYDACWSNDSQRLYFTLKFNSIASYQDVIHIADIQGNQIKPFAGEIQYGEGISFNSPVCNPDGPSLAVISQANIRVPSRRLLLLQTEDMQETVIEDKSSSIPANISWSLDGKTLLYQISDISTSERKQSIWSWQMDGSKTWICDECYYPEWLP